MRLGLALAAVASFAAMAAPAAAQSRLQVSVALPAPSLRTAQGPMVSLQNLFSDDRTRELLASGFPARVTTVVELWGRGALFDHPIRTVSWQRVVRFDPLASTFRLGRVAGADSVAEEGSYGTLDGVRRAVSAPTRATLPAPPGAGPMYYIVNVTVETFSSNDLDEVQRWLNGDMEPAIHGEKNPISALKRGVLTIFSRLLGGDVKHETARSDVFATS